MHLDGARLWNASIASGVAMHEYGACAHTVSVCFSKGLGAPVGSALASDSDTIRRAHRLRKMWGGGMRQVGILAAAALYALDHNLPQMGEDHDKAKQLERAIGRCKTLRMERPVETNILIVEVTDPRDSPAAVFEDLKREGVLVKPWSERTFRSQKHIGYADSSARESLTLRVETSNPRGSFTLRTRVGRRNSERSPSRDKGSPHARHCAARHGRLGAGVMLLSPRGRLTEGRARNVRDPERPARPEPAPSTT